MKKTSLVLFPVLAGLLLAGCTTTKKSSKKKKSSASGEVTSKTTSQGGGGGGTSQGGTSQGGTSQGSGGSGGNGTVTLTNKADLSSQSDETAVYSNDGYTVTIERNGCAQSVTQAISASGSYELRIYAGMKMTIAAPSAFSTFIVRYSTYQQQSGTTYYFDYDITGGTNSHDDTTGVATCTLNSATSSFEVTCTHQTRVASVSFSS